MTERTRAKQFDVEQCQRGWEKQREHSYWVPLADVEGKLPQDLHGTLFRNGPGLHEVYGKKLKHPIDGDGMVCALTFLNGHVHFKSKFVSTKHREEEQEKQDFLYMGQMGTREKSLVMDTLKAMRSVITARTPKLKFRNPSNTNAVYWGGKLLTMYETHLPYCLDPRTLETLAIEKLNGNLTLGTFGAHFRIDPLHKRLVCMSLRPGLLYQPSLGMYEFNEDWTLHKKQIYHIDGLNYSHDFLLLPNYYIFHMSPFVKVSYWLAFKIAAGWTSPGESMRYYPELPSKFVLIPRDPARKDDIIIVDTDPCHIFHFGTAKENDDDITFNAVCLDSKFDMSFDEGIWLSNTSVAPGYVFNFRINLKKKTCVREKTDKASVEFPSVHPYRHGLAGTRYSFLMANDRPGQNMPFRDIVKYDALGQSRQAWYSDGVIGEPVFVPRYGYESTSLGDEDDGYVLVQLYHPGKHCTDFCVLDAKNIGSGPIARIKLKHHVPYGFHGTFTPECFIQSSIPIQKSKL